MADADDTPLTPAAAQRLVDLIGLFELAASAGDELTEDQARLLMDAERAAHGRTQEQP